MVRSDVFDLEGKLVVRAFHRSKDDGEPERWMVIASDGRYLGTVTMPPGFAVTEIGSDHVVGIARDSLDVEHVEVRQIEKRR